MTGGGFTLPSAHDDESDGYSDSYDPEDGNVRLEMADLGSTNGRASVSGSGFAGDGSNGLESGLGKRREIEWVGKPHVVGPEWMKMPLLTVGMLGLQCVWSIEMGYASPYLLQLGLSKSLMSLVFVAGPLSGLVMQPLIGVLADRSKSRFGRRRPFMLMGCVIAVVGMMLLGWAKEVAGFFGGGSTTAIWFAVFSIYLIDFSINAVQATDRALVVDILPPSQQEKGNAWAGRMFGTGSLAGFYVGNINLVKIFPIFGKTQLQVLSLLTSVALLGTHGMTAYSTKERVLLRDTRKSSQDGFVANIKSIWTGYLQLPRSIKMICYTQFFAWIGWFPILFYTSVWVGEIYTREQLSMGRSADDPELEQDANRAGSRALLYNAMINLSTSIVLPFLVSSSGIQGSRPAIKVPSFREPGPRGDDVFSRAMDRFGDRLDVLRAWTRVPARLRLQLPIPGFTLIRAWIMGQAMFTTTMFATYFAHSTASANFVIGLNGFCWAVAQWAPFSLLGELILLDNAPARGQRTIVPGDAADAEDEAPGPRTSTAMVDQEEEEHLLRTAEMPSSLLGRPNGHARSLSASSSAVDHDEKGRIRTPNGSRKTSHEGRSEREDHSGGPSRSSLELPRKSADGGGRAGRSPLSRSRSTESTHELSVLEEVRLSLAEEDENAREKYGFNADGGASHLPLESPKKRRKRTHHSTAEKAGVILGIHNIFIVIPQFLVTLLSSVIFYLLEPTRPSIPDAHHVGNVIPIEANSTLSEVDPFTVDTEFRRLLARELDAHVTSGPDSVGLIFRLGGVCAAVAGYMCWKMSREWARQGV